MPQYQGVWTLQQQMQALTSGQWATDPLFDYTTLLLQGDAGANGAQNNVFYDTSPNQFAITRNGNTTQGSFTPFSATGWSNYFDGSGDYLTSTVSSVGSSGDLTVEGWVYPTASGVRRTFFFIGSTGTFDLNLFSEITTGNVLRFLIRNDSVVDILDISSTTTVSTNTWSHVAFVLSGTSATIYLNGTSVATGTLSGTRTGTFTTGSIGALLSGGATHYFNGYISNLRYVKGTAVYTSNFTPSPTPLTAITNTSLLTCQSNRFVDNSTNAYAITRNGDTSVQPFSPFAPQYQWTSDVIGGSGYFDGTGDYLTLPAGSSWLFTGDHCLEAWVYWTTSTAMVIYATGGASSADQFILSPPSEGIWWGTTSLSSSVLPQVNAWNHVCVTRQGSTIRRFLNGQLITTSTNSGSIGSNSATPYIGARSGSSLFFNGYISQLRIINGSVPTSYQTSSTTINAQIFTPPTAPLTTTSQGATSGDVKLLFSAANAGIYDGTMKNDLETAGNAQISTAVVKYGSGSMYFDGSGDYLRPNSGNIFNFGTGDFTVEFWLYLNATTAQTFIDCRPGSAGDYILFDYDPTLRLYVGSTTVLSGKSLSTGQWYHIALARSGSTVKYFVNGVQEASATMTTNLLSASNPYIGSNYVPGAYLNGYIDDLRITKGIARYITNFTPPLVALPRQ